MMVQCWMMDQSLKLLPEMVSAGNNQRGEEWTPVDNVIKTFLPALIFNYVKLEC
jgi:hypothetical protein